ncbi:GDP-mannose-dependent alpha-mannosyltransferase [Hondaea fermentalgiana]|uniref:GDP-mannose-dependent alpha-mannosyltransferase n=1 Tax=Hondaea fermentalgiana TaxID=2315210 RepID=A0A2R5G895_9STRA|nr:GDP-mannose-dependent alpha-mannosyltransferase [Hondaea fermentalgiana]|eukprot:GBG26765.1 GDP-mannose-dependent alpha-mannosyltransferase [Hondaea fermentalgiana]
MRFDAPISDETNEFHIRDADEANFRRIWWRPAAPSTASMKKSPSLDLIHRMVGAFEGADILFFANSKEFTDVLLVETARLAGIGRIIMDLPNTDPHPEISPDIVVAPSRATLRETSVKRLAGAKMVIYPGADLDRFAIAQNVRLPPRCVIGFVARLEPEKSAGLFIDMVTKLHTTACDFVIVGDGSMFSSLRMLARKLGVQHKIHFTGMLHGDALPFMMARMYVIVNPSTSETETFCIVNIEAMALGIPLVSFGAGGVSDYLEHGVNGILVDEVSGHGLARGVQLALKMRDVLSIGARKTARKFSLASMTAKYLAFVE